MKLILFLLISNILNIYGGDMERKLKVNTNYELHSYDTLKGDGFDLMFFFKNIYAGLVSDFRNGHIDPMIAESWDISSDGTIWKFKIRKGLKFTDGSNITVEEVYKSFMRVLWLTRDNKTRLHESLVGLEEWKDYKKGFKGIAIEDGEIVFRFKKRPNNIFETLSQSMFQIVSSKCYDENGIWKDEKCYIGSGQYKIIKMTKDITILKNRHLYPEVKDSPDIVEIYSSKSNFLSQLYKRNADFTLAQNISLDEQNKQELYKNNYLITERPPVNMIFLELNWRRSPFNDKKLRQFIRDIFINRIKEELKDYKTDFSFIPKGGVGYVKFNVPNEIRNKVRSCDKPVELITIKRDTNSLTARAEKIFIELLNEHKINVDIKVSDKTMERRKSGNYDAVYVMSGLLINDPWADLRLIFMSDIGAHIPDPSGKIPSLIEKAEKENNPIERKKIAEEINKIIYDEASVITFLHLSIDYLHKKYIDTSFINLFSDPIEFRCVSVKNK